MFVRRESSARFSSAIICNLFHVEGVRFCFRACTSFCEISHRHLYSWRCLDDLQRISAFDLLTCSFFRMWLYSVSGFVHSCVQVDFVCSACFVYFATARTVFIACSVISSRDVPVCRRLNMIHDMVHALLWNWDVFVSPS